MATGRRPARMNVQTMYPNFHAEQHKHHVQQNNTMVLPGKRRERSGGTKQVDFVHSTRPPSRNGPQRVPNRDDMDARHISSAERSRQAILPIVLKRSSNQHETMTPAGQSDSDFQTPIVIEPSLRPSSRQVALRGELSLTAPAWEDNNIAGISPRLRPLPFPTSLTRSAPSLLEATTARLSDSVGGESLQDLVVNARPRSRYARRELHRQGSAKNLARISTAPSILRGNQSLDGTSMTARVGTPLINSRSTGNLLFDLSRRPANHQDAQVAVINTVEAVLPGNEPDNGADDDDDTNFFLTELEAAARAASAAAAAKLRILARHVTLGSFLLYGTPPALAVAIQHFTAALKSVEEGTSCKSRSSAGWALMSLLHHHRGVALRELVVSSAAPTSKIARACTKLAFVAQRRAHELAQRAKDPRLQARAVKALGLLLLDAHAYGPALTHQQEALQFALEEKDRELEARVYANLGNLALAQLNFGHALSCHHRDLYLCSSKVLDCRLGRARAHKNLSIVYAKLHRCNQQLNHEKEARTAAYHNGGAYLYDITNHANTSVGNICLQSSTTIDPALVTLVSQNLAEIARELSVRRSRGTTLKNEDDSSIVAALEQEWSTAEMDLETAVAAVTTEGDIEIRSTPMSTSTSKPTSSHCVSIRIDNYSVPSLPAPEVSLQSPQL